MSRTTHRHVGVVGQQLDVGNPQAVLELLATLDPEPLRADAGDHHQARLRALELRDARERADGKEGLAREAVARRLAVGGARPAAGVRPFAQADDAERFAGLVAVAYHVQVAHLEDAQRQGAAREQDRLERKQRQRCQLRRRGAHR
jgi:hypothetical protein